MPNATGVKIFFLLKAKRLRREKFLFAKEYAIGKPKNSNSFMIDLIA